MSPLLPSPSTDKKNDLSEAPPSLSEEKLSSRRHFMKGAAVLSGAKLASGVICMDANPELLELCTQFHALERLSQELWDETNPSLWTDLLHNQQLLAERIIAFSPTTLREFRALARAIMGWTPNMPLEDIDDLTGRDSQLLFCLLRNLVGANAK